MLMENPWVSDSWDHKALEEVLLDPALDFVRGDMCCWGRCDAVSGLSYLKPIDFAVNKRILAERLSCRCRGGHAHQRIQGNNGPGDRSAQAAGYPRSLAIEVVVGVCEELLERNLEKRAFPAEVETSPRAARSKDNLARTF